MHLCGDGLACLAEDRIVFVSVGPDLIFIFAALRCRLFVYEFGLIRLADHFAVADDLIPESSVDFCVTELHLALSRVDLELWSIEARLCGRGFFFIESGRLETVSGGDGIVICPSGPQFFILVLRISRCCQILVMDAVLRSVDAVSDRVVRRIPRNINCRIRTVCDLEPAHFCRWRNRY